MSSDSSIASQALANGSPAAPHPVVVRPWLRFFARQFDYLAFGFVSVIVISLLTPAVLDLPEMALTPILALLWIPFEAAFVSIFAATPGKWLLGIRVTAKRGDLLSFQAAISRSFLVWFIGMGLGVPILSLLANALGYRELKTNASTRWDRATRSSVDHAPLEPARVGLAAVAMAGCVGLVVFFFYFDDSIKRAARSELDAARHAVEAVAADAGASILPHGDVVFVDLDNQFREEFTIDATPGEGVVVVAGCDADCHDLDLALIDPKGEEVDRDSEPGARPVVGAPSVQGLSYRLVLEMHECTVEPCTVAFQVFTADSIFWSSGGEGTCFVVDPRGLALTAHHVVGSAETVAVVLSNGSAVAATVARRSEENDLAVLRLPEGFPHFLPLARATPVELGDPVFTIGFPASDLLGYDPKFSEGVIAALSGGRESALLQTTVPIQPGSSGGPLVTMNGEAVGVVVSTAAVEPFFEDYGAIPQNVNFAVKASLASELLNTDAHLRTTRSRREAITRAERALCMVRDVSRLDERVPGWSDVRPAPARSKTKAPHARALEPVVSDSHLWAAEVQGGYEFAYGTYLHEGRFSGFVYSPDVQEGFVRLAQGDPGGALESWLVLANSGNRNAKVNAAVLLYRGTAGRTDFETAALFLIDVQKGLPYFDFSNAHLVRLMQTALERLGYDPGPVDGEAGPRSTAARAAFWRDAFPGRSWQGVPYEEEFLAIARAADSSRPER